MFKCYAVLSLDRANHDTFDQILLNERINKQDWKRCDDHGRELDRRG